MNKKIFVIAFVAWSVIWAYFIARELFMKGGAKEYGVLLSRSLDGKRSYVTGDTLYEFIRFSGRCLPPGATYEWAGLEEGSLDKRRAAYYLYPLIEKRPAEYLLGYRIPRPTEGDYELFAGLDTERYILKKKAKVH